MARKENSRFMPFYFDDFEEATTHLTDKQKWIYFKMIWWQFHNKAPFKSVEQIRKLLGFSSKENAIIEDLLHAFFVQMEDKSLPNRSDTASKSLPNRFQTADGWMQNRTLEEIDRVASKSVLARDSANCRWKKTDANALLEEKRREDNTPNPLSGDFPQKNGLIEEESVSNQGFKAFWGVYPLKISKAQAIEKYAKALYFADEKTILEGAKKYAKWCEKQAEQAKKLKKPATTPLKASSWLFHKRWEDELEPTKTTPKTHLDTILGAETVQDITTGKTYKPNDAKHERRFDSDELTFPCGDRVDVKFLRKV